MTRARLRRLAPPVLFACAVACTSTPAREGGTIAGESAHYDVSGQYEPLELAEVDRLAREDGTVAVKGATGSVTVELPPEADVSQPNPAWRLVTESQAAEGARHLTFTHETSLDDFSIMLPPGDAEVHYGAFLARGGGSVLVLAWGDEGRSYWGWVTIRRKAE